MYIYISLYIEIIVYIYIYHYIIYIYIIIYISLYVDHDIYIYKSIYIYIYVNINIISYYIYVYINNICLSAITPLFSIFSAQRLPSAPPIGTETKDQRQSGKGWPNIVAEMAGKPMGLPWAIYEWLVGRLNGLSTIEHCPWIPMIPLNIAPFIYHIMVFLFHWFYDKIWF